MLEEQVKKEKRSEKDIIEEILLRLNNILEFNRRPYMNTTMVAELKMRIDELKELVDLLQLEHSFLSIDAINNLRRVIQHLIQRAESRDDLIKSRRKYAHK